MNKSRKCKDKCGDVNLSVCNFCLELCVDDDLLGHSQKSTSLCNHSMGHVRCCRSPASSSLREVICLISLCASLLSAFSDDFGHDDKSSHVDVGTSSPNGPCTAGTVICLERLLDRWRQGDSG